MPDLIVIFQHEGINDQYLMKIEHVHVTKKPIRPFKYYNVWSCHPKIVSRVETVWQTPVEGCLMLQVVKKLKLLKQTLKELNRKHFGNIITEVAEDKGELTKAQLALQMDPMDQALQEKEKAKFQKFRRSLYLAEVFLQ